MSIAFLFPGQGSQKVGMGADLVSAYAGARKVFDIASQVTGMDLQRLCFEGPMQALTQTANLQPAMTVVNLALLSVLKENGIESTVTAGHSLGEYSALVAAGVLSVEDAFRLVRRRGELMEQEANIHKGAMAAIVGLDAVQVGTLVDAVQTETDVVSVANYNSAEQIVITGAAAPVAQVAAAAKEKGARAIPLKVSGAWHSGLMKGAQAPFRQALAEATFNAPAIPVIFNVSAKSAEDPETIRDWMGRQLSQPVRWYEGMQRLLLQPPETIVEVGAGKVLTGLIKRMLPQAPPIEVHTVNDARSLERFVAAMQSK